jgi:hypothetical protein
MSTTTSIRIDQRSTIWPKPMPLPSTGLSPAKLNIGRNSGAPPWDLADFLVHKFRSQGQLWLLGYTLDDEVRLVYLEALGPHENFYRDLKGR